MANLKEAFLSAKTRQTDRDLLRYRILFLMGAAIYPAWWPIFHYSVPGSVDPLWERAVVSAACLLGFALTFMSQGLARNTRPIVMAAALLMTAQYFSLVHRNGMEPHYAAATFVVVFAVASCFHERRDILVYSVLSFAGVCVLAALHTNFSRAVLIAGHLTGVVVPYVALSSRLHLVESLMESEERFRTMADAAPVMIWVTDENGFASFFNDGWLKFTGNDMASVAGNGWTKFVHPEDLNGYLEAYFAAFRARKPLKAEYRLRRADSEWRRVFAQNIPLYQPNGAFSGYIGSCVDITESKPPAAQTAQ